MKSVKLNKLRSGRVLGGEQACRDDKLARERLKKTGSVKNEETCRYRIFQRIYFDRDRGNIPQLAHVSTDSVPPPPPSHFITSLRPRKDITIQNYSGTSNNGHYRGISIFSVITGVR
jgi:hypothetical protein